MSSLELFGDAVARDARPLRERRPAPPARTQRRTGIPAPRERDCAGVGTESELRRLRAPAREGRTLEDVISGAWEDLVAHRTTACPICAGELACRHGSERGAAVAACASCGTSLG